jgi:ribosome-associated toxin RatA of RatAB toxin-antitoxin module
MSHGFNTIANRCRLGGDKTLHSMKTVHKSVLIWYSAEEMFALVTDIASYPSFLPWCDRAIVQAVEADGVVAEVGISISGIRQSFVTRNVHSHVGILGRKVQLTLVKGPFSDLNGEWSFTPLEAVPDADSTVPPASPRACRVDLRLNYSFDNAALSALVGPVFDRIAGSLVDAFVKRAEQVYA